jgi:hypothetical protein
MTEEEAFLESVRYGKTDFQARTKERDASENLIFAPLGHCVGV